MLNQLIDDLNDMKDPLTQGNRLEDDINGCKNYTVKHS